MITKIISVIFMCWTPADSLDLAKAHPEWELTGHGIYFKHQFQETFIETWIIEEKVLVVEYNHPLMGNKELWCYSKEEYK